MEIWLLFAILLVVILLLTKTNSAYFELVERLNNLAERIEKAFNQNNKD